MILIKRPGTARSRDKRMTLRSKGARLVLRGLRFGKWVATGLEPIFFHPPEQGAAAQAGHFRRLTHITLKALQRLSNKNTFHGLQTQFLKILCSRTLNSDANITVPNFLVAAHQSRPFQPLP